MKGDLPIYAYCCKNAALTYLWRGPEDFMVQLWCLQKFFLCTQNPSLSNNLWGTYYVKHIARHKGIDYKVEEEMAFALSNS